MAVVDPTSHQGESQSGHVSVINMWKNLRGVQLFILKAIKFDRRFLASLKCALLLAVIDRSVKRGLLRTQEAERSSRGAERVPTSARSFCVSACRSMRQGKMISRWMHVFSLFVFVVKM